MEKKVAIAIDGPAGSGKSTIAKLLAQKLNYIYVDTGAMYRSIALKALKEEGDLANESYLTELAKKTAIRLEPYENDEGLYLNKVYLDGVDVTEDIRMPMVNQNVSLVAKVPGVRAELVDQQRKMAEAGGTVMDGRDIGTVVLPKAEVKVFLTASIEERANRRYKELKEKGYDMSLEELQKDIAKRDKIDSEREASPLKQADDAVLVDTTGLSIEAVLARLVELYEERVK